jgi:hypothetical protein
MRLIIGVLVLAMAGGAYAQERLSETPRGAVAISGNELTVDSSVNDPPAIRLGAPATQPSLGKISFDVLDQSREEIVLIQGKQTDDGGRGGELYLGLKKPFTATSDAAMGTALTATWQDGFQFNLPISAPNLQRGDGTIVVGNWFIQSPNGRCRTYLLDDGNLVAYEVMQPGNWLRPYWSMYGGMIAPPCGAAAAR